MASRKIKYDFNPLKGLRGEARTRAAEEIKIFVRRSVLARLREGSSPVSGARSFKPLSKKYATAKKNGDRTPNLRLEGDLYASIEVTESPTGGLRLTVSEDQQGKADGHNNFSGKSELPRRAFVPDALREEKFKQDIESGIKAIADRYRSKDGA